MPMPHGSDKSPEKNFNEIRHSLCMPHGSNKSWQPMKNLNIVKKLNRLLCNCRPLRNKMVSQTHPAVFDDIIRFPRQQSSDII